jgi:hypothetical protein
MRKINMEEYLTDSSRFVLKSGSIEGAPLCPFGNPFQWIGFDTGTQEFVRFTKSVFKLLVNQEDNE